MTLRIEEGEESSEVPRHLRKNLAAIGREKACIDYFKRSIRLLNRSFGFALRICSNRRLFMYPEGVVAFRQLQTCMDVIENHGQQLANSAGFSDPPGNPDLFLDA